ncbi:Armadillo repeat-containing protein 3 and Serine/threonine-protein kinase CTR1 [Artemisia annua]|uniref:Armadillo repeat-containing protein 3 and Serine/threonine-protein kinase CTR1 n=1 Tax=Artemisia annua TaxID=35608 RepID=A0A2U1QD42_ARTAN|nr:Armadillo repeat-containing protein 3 and Serine/threonine-protein kinase CTR1 [Artemisia annua]
MISSKKSFTFSEDAVIPSMCEKYLQLVKARRNSVVVPVGSLQYGVCRHRALLMKYLCDRVTPRVPCELVRGYLDFSPHAWNVVAAKRGDSEVRFVVDACRPQDIRQESHQISTKWLPSEDGTPEAHVAWALSELYSKDIIHHDLKSGNVLIDINNDTDGATVVKLCDFDTAVPLGSSLHKCCVGHTGIPPPDACVGKVRLMAPEVYRTLHDRRVYGLEVDLWSFGCLILELLTLRLPYAGLQESKIHELILLGIRPLLTDELEALGRVEDIEETESESEKYKKEKTMRF